MAAAPSRVIYSMEIRRSRYLRRFMLLLVGTLAAASAYIALDIAASRGLLDLLVLDAGKVVALVLGGLLAVRGLYNLVLVLIRRSESLNVYSKGFIWNVGGKAYKYRWTDLTRFREGARGIYLFNRPLLRWGAHVLQMEDERVFKFTARHGDPRVFARVVRPYAAYVTSIKISKQLREDRPVRLHPRLTLYPGGVEAGKTQIRWAELDVLVRGRRLLVRRHTGKSTKTIRRYSIASLDNAGGFVEIVKSTERLYQPGRATQRSRTRSQPPGNALSA